ncbi:MAG: hypothetical protein ACFE9N_03525 [Promethearchaeota archaeon]
MEKRRVSIFNIIIIIIGIVFVISGSGLLWTSFTIAEGGLVRAPAVLLLFIGIVIFILGIRKLYKSRKEINT